MSLALYCTPETEVHGSFLHTVKQQEMNQFTVLLHHTPEHECGGLITVFNEIWGFFQLQHNVSLFQVFLLVCLFLGLIIIGFLLVKYDCLFCPSILLTNDLGLGLDTL